MTSRRFWRRSGATGWALTAPATLAVIGFLIVPIGMVIGATPLFPGGAGIGEAGFGGLYALVGATAAAGVLASLVQRVITWVLGLIGYIVYLRLKATRHPAPAQSVELTPVEA